jgi:hypothetical protein
VSDDFLQRIFLTGEDSARCVGSLSKMAGHLEEPVTITGGIAVGWHLLKNGTPGEKRRLNDIDLVVRDLSFLRRSLRDDFLISHFHPTRERGKILIQLVDEKYGTRIDVFTTGTERLTERLTNFITREVSGRFVSAEDLLAKLLSIIFPAAGGIPVERKYVEQFNALSAVADLETVRNVWREYRKENTPLDFDEATKAVRQGIAASPGLLEAGRYNQDLTYKCPWCRESKLFPLESRSKIYEILGYV